MSAAMRWRIFWRSLLLQACWNFERMQSLGLAYCLQPWLERIYRGRPEELRRALSRHQEFFNTQPYAASLIAGVVCAMEESAAVLPEGEKAGQWERIRTLKGALAATLAGLGDAFFWKTLSPFCAALALSVALALWPAPASFLAAAASYLVCYNAFSLSLRWAGLGMGYRWGGKVALKLREMPIQKSMLFLRLLGGTLALAACAYGLAAVSRQSRGLAAGAAAVFLVLKAAGLSSYGLYAGACAAGFLGAAAGWL